MWIEGGEGVEEEQVTIREIRKLPRGRNMGWTATTLISNLARKSYIFCLFDT